MSHYNIAVYWFKKIRDNLINYKKQILQLKYSPISETGSHDLT